MRAQYRQILLIHELVAWSKDKASTDGCARGTRIGRRGAVDHLADVRPDHQLWSGTRPGIVDPVHHAYLQTPHLAALEEKLMKVVCSLEPCSKVRNEGRELGLFCFCLDCSILPEL